MASDPDAPVARPRRRITPAGAAVVAVFGAAGLLFATSAATAHGTQLRADRTDLAGLIRSENAALDAQQRRLADLRKQVDGLTATVAQGDSQVADLRRRSDGVSPDAGLTPVAGRGLVVTLDDAPPGSRPAGARPDDLVVHQQDVQAVVNALWSGGAEAMMLMDQRVISTSAVQCVGNTLLLQGRVYSPPYRITAIGDPALLRKALALSAQVQIYQQYVSTVHLVFELRTVASVVMPGFDGSIELRYARVPSPSPSASGSGPGGTPSASGGP